MEFGKFIASKEFENLKISDEYWRSVSDKFPKLSKLACLLNILVSTSFIERFFSLCGFINNPRSTNISDDLFIEKTLLKANLWILE